MIFLEGSLVNHIDNAEWAVMRKGRILNYLGLKHLRTLFKDNDDLRRHQALSVIDKFFKTADDDIELHFLYGGVLYVVRYNTGYLKNELEELLKYFEKRVYGGDE